MLMYPLLPTYIHAENLEVCKNWCKFATLGGAHAQRGLQYLFVCPAVGPLPRFLPPRATNR